MDRPKFCVGEEVMTRSDVTPELDVDRAEVLEARKSLSGYELSNHPGYQGWVYKVSGPTSAIGVYIEPNLRKIPPEDRTQFDDEVWNPLRETA